MTPREYYEHALQRRPDDRPGNPELPKVWVVGGDGGMGDIGYQNMSKVILQNRPNVKAVMLDTQVYSNTGGQNSDSTPMLGGNDMNVFGAATQGKNHEKKTVAETFLAGHGSPFVAQVSIANAPKLYRAILDSLEYRGTAFLQCFTTCQPEHGVADDLALTQAQRVRDSRGAPEFVFNPRLGETYQEALDVKGNPSIDIDRMRRSSKPPTSSIATRSPTGARPKRASAITSRRSRDDAAKLIPLENMLVRITQQDVVYRSTCARSTVRSSRISASTSVSRGRMATSSIGRFRASSSCSAWSAARRGGCCRARPASRIAKAQRSLLADVDAGKVSKEHLFTYAEQLLKERMPAAGGAHKPAEPRVTPPPAAAAAAGSTVAFRNRAGRIQLRAGPRLAPHHGADGDIIRANLHLLTARNRHEVDLHGADRHLPGRGSRGRPGPVRHDSRHSDEKSPGRKRRGHHSRHGRLSRALRRLSRHGRPWIRGPDITQVWAKGRTDAALFSTIHNGVPGTEMPAFPAPRTSDMDVWRILAYLKTMAAPAPDGPPRGNAGAGENVFAANCMGCHRVGERAETSTRPLAHRHRACACRHGAADSRHRSGFPHWLRAGDADDSQRAGDSRRQEERRPFSVQVMDNRERIQGYLREDMRSVTNEKKSAMPTFGSTSSR